MVPSKVIKVMHPWSGTAKTAYRSSKWQVLLGSVMIWYLDNCLGDNCLVSQTTIESHLSFRPQKCINYCWNLRNYQNDFVPSSFKRINPTWNPVVDRVVNSNRFLKIIYCYHFQKDNHPVDETAFLHMGESIILMWKQ